MTEEETMSNPNLYHWSGTGVIAIDNGCGSVALDKKGIRKLLEYISNYKEDLGLEGINL